MALAQAAEFLLFSRQLSLNLRQLITRVGKPAILFVKLTGSLIALGVEPD